MNDLYINITYFFIRIYTFKKNMKHTVIAISLPEDLVKKIESNRFDLPRSLVYKRILEAGLKKESKN